MNGDSGMEHERKEGSKKVLENLGMHKENCWWEQLTVFSFFESSKWGITYEDDPRESSDDNFTCLSYLIVLPQDLSLAKNRRHSK